MKRYDTMVELLGDQRSTGNAIHFIDGENDESEVSFDDLWSRARRFLAALQTRGMQPGDELIVFTKSTERFLIAFWATPHMTVGHLLFAATCTAYILIALRIEEATLIELHGAQYEDYRKRVRGLIPIPR